MRKNREPANRIFPILLPLLGAAFCLWYLSVSSADAVYSDYIRLIHDYLPDVGDFKKLLTPDILTRTPVYFLARYVNVRTFGYSVTFERVLTVAGLFLIALSVEIFAFREKVNPFYHAVIFVVLFSLTKWENLLNGTCWTHVVSIGLFLLNFLLFDRVWKDESEPSLEVLLYLMPFLWLLFAGEYIASYAGAMCLICLFGMLTGGKSGSSKRVIKICLRIFLATVTAFLLYLWSRSFAEWEHAGGTDMTLLELIKFAPSFLPKFFVKSLAGTVFGGEVVENFKNGQALPNIFVLLTGVTVLLAYGFALIIYFYNGIYERTVFPLLLLVSGFLNHGLVTYARWIFLNENYGLSSRYGVQFMVGILGILLIFSLYRIPQKSYRHRASEKRLRGIRAFMIFFAAFLCAGNLYTSYKEIKKAPYRQENYEKMAEAILHKEELSDEELCATLEWHKDPGVLRESLQILEDNGLNVYHTSAIGWEKGTE